MYERCITRSVRNMLDRGGKDDVFLSLRGVGQPCWGGVGSTQNLDQTCRWLFVWTVSNN